MISAIGNLWFIIFMLFYAGLQLFCIAINCIIEERRVSHEEVHNRKNRSYARKNHGINHGRKKRIHHDKMRYRAEGDNALRPVFLENTG